MVMKNVDTSITVFREGNCTSSENHILDEIDFFKGEENSILMNQTYTKNFHCFYRFEFYPFDTQVVQSLLLMILCQFYIGMQYRPSCQRV